MLAHNTMFALMLLQLLHTAIAFPFMGQGSDDHVKLKHVKTTQASNEDVFSRAVINEAPYSWSPNLLVDVTGAHAYQDPLPGQARGPCPAQNALANHGYLDRSGYTSFTQCLQANVLVFNLGPDFTSFLCLLANFAGGSAWTVDGFSIGNSSQFDSTVTNKCQIPGGLLGIVQGLLCHLADFLTGALGTPDYGLAQTHNVFETDDSLFSYDWGTYGLDASTVDLGQVNLFWSQYCDAQGNFDDYSKFISWMSQRKAYSTATNPCYLRVLQTIFAAQGAIVFTRPMYANNTPSGQTLTSDTLASFMGLNVNPNNRVVTSKGFGKERIPNNWYKSYISYTVPYFFAVHYSQFFAKDPSLASLGGNTNGVNTFTGLDIGDLTQGVINGQNLLNGDNFVCLLWRVLQLAFADKLNSAVVGSLLSIAATTGQVLNIVFSNMMQNPQGVSTCRTDYQWKDEHAYTGYCAVQRQSGAMY